MQVGGSRRVGSRLSPDSVACHDPCDELVEAYSTMGKEGRSPVDHHRRCQGSGAAVVATAFGPMAQNQHLVGDGSMERHRQLARYRRASSVFLQEDPACRSEPFRVGGQAREVFRPCERLCQQKAADAIDPTTIMGAPTRHGLSPCGSTGSSE